MGKDFELNGRCLAYHGPLLYEARIIKTHDANSDKVEDVKGRSQTLVELNLPDFLKGEDLYFVHYKGWKSSWDEWVTDVRILTYSPENLQLQKDLKQATLKLVAPAKKAYLRRSSSPLDSAKKNLTSSQPENGSSQPSVSSTASSTTTSNGHTNKKQKKNPTLESEDEFLKRPEIHLSIPDELKLLLVDDWEYVTKENQLKTLPLDVTVTQLLLKYVEHRKKVKRDDLSQANLEEIVEGLKLYFNRTLSSILLYKFERQQYRDVMARSANKNKSACDIYGCEHLLRLFVSLPGLIAQTSMDQQSVSTLKAFLEHMMRYMLSNLKEFFVTKYENTTPAYELANKI